VTGGARAVILVKVAELTAVDEGLEDILLHVEVVVAISDIRVRRAGRFSTPLLMR
jgi:hypothetical protein